MICFTISQWLMLELSCWFESVCHWNRTLGLFCSILLFPPFLKDSVSYPLSAPGPQFKRFKSSLSEFAQLLVNSCQNSFIYDEYLFPTLLALLVGLSDSQVRPFRHTCTLLGKPIPGYSEQSIISLISIVAVNKMTNLYFRKVFISKKKRSFCMFFLCFSVAMKLMTGLVRVSLGVSIQLQTTQKRYDIECSKSAPDRASDRLEELKAYGNEVTRHFSYSLLQLISFFHTLGSTQGLGNNCRWQIKIW